VGNRTVRYISLFVRGRKGKSKGDAEAIRWEGRLEGELGFDWYT